MAILVAQTQSGMATTFGSAVATGNSVFLVVTAANTSGAVITTSNPQFASAAVGTAVRVQEKYAVSGSFACYHAMWMLPAVGNGSASDYGITLTGGFEIATRALDVSGLGSAPAMDRDSSGSHPSSTAVNSGTTATTRYTPELVLGVGQIFAGSGAGPGGAWTMLASGANGWIGYQIAVATGTFSWAQTASGAGPWTSGVVTVAAAVTTPDSPHTLISSYSSFH